MLGSFGCLACAIPGSFGLKLDNYTIYTNSGYVEKRLRKMIIAVTTGFKKHFRIRGVGYHLKPSDKNIITLVAGFSYDVNCNLHPSIQIKGTRKFTMIKTQSKYLATTTNNIALIRNTRQADVYRGLGIYYRYEKILYKLGSKQKTKK